MFARRDRRSNPASVFRRTLTKQLTGRRAVHSGSDETVNWDAGVLLHPTAHSRAVSFALTGRMPAGLPPGRRLASADQRPGRRQQPLRSRPRAAHSSRPGVYRATTLPPADRFRVCDRAARQTKSAERSSRSSFLGITPRESGCDRSAGEPRYVTPKYGSMSSRPQCDHRTVGQNLERREHHGSCASRLCDGSLTSYAELRDRVPRLRPRAPPLLCMDPQSAFQNWNLTAWPRQESRLP
jgi:hypothetical protein